MPNQTVVFVAVDDKTRKRLAGLLRDLGYRGLPAVTEEEAMALLNAQLVDALIVDLAHPGLDAHALRGRMLELPDRRNIPCLYIVDGDAGPVPPDVTADAVDATVAKPIRASDFSAKLAAVLAHRSTYAQMARPDPLTNLSNREMFIREASLRLERQRLAKGMATIAVVHIDHFDERPGRESPRGLRLLGALGRVLKRGCRNSDYIGRLAPNEFAVYFASAPADTAAAVLHRIQERFAEAAADAGGHGATFSAGLARAFTDGEDLHTLCNRARRALEIGQRRQAGTILAWRPEMQPAVE